MSGPSAANNEEDKSGGAGSVGAAAVIGVVGAGTMGAGIAQLAARAGARTLLHDPIAEALAGGVQKIEDGLGKEAAEGPTLRASRRARRRARWSRSPSSPQLAPCELVIEAAPERLELKHEIYGGCRRSSTSGACWPATPRRCWSRRSRRRRAHPERVVGMHFFNPAPIMRLLEVVAGEQSSARALALATRRARRWARRVIRASDGPGFLVNRCNRPFGLEALRLLQERIADVPTIDRICRMQGGFRMGPFELMDLVGVDVGFEISKSFYAQSFGEPRWRPSPIAARYVAAGLHGRKTKRGYYVPTSRRRAPTDRHIARRTPKPREVERPAPARASS